jgi:hypothetical protein
MADMHQVMKNKVKGATFLQLTQWRKFDSGRGAQCVRLQQEGKMLKAYAHDELEKRRKQWEVYSFVEKDAPTSAIGGEGSSTVLPYLPLYRTPDVEIADPTCGQGCEDAENGVGGRLGDDDTPVC